MPLYRLGPSRSSKGYRTDSKSGSRRFQLKLGASPHDDAERVRRIHEQSADDELIVADANGGWRLQDAVIAARLLDGLDRVFLEQPCATLEECAVVRSRTTLPMILDEVVTDVHTLLRACRAQVMEALNLKISKVGGLSKARLMRDLADLLALSSLDRSTWGGDLATAAIAHLAASTSPEATFMVSFVNDLTIGSVAGRQPHSEGGFGSAPAGAGLALTWTSSVSVSPSSQSNNNGMPCRASRLSHERPAWCSKPRACRDGSSRWPRRREPHLRQQLPNGTGITDITTVTAVAGMPSIEDDPNARQGKPGSDHAAIAVASTSDVRPLRWARAVGSTGSE